MRLTSLILALFACWASSFSQIQQIAVNSAPAPEGYDLEIEVVSEDIGLLVGALGPVDLTGYSCTQLYVTMNNEDDFFSSVSGDAVNPTFVNTTTSFYHAILGAATPNGINSLLFGVYPDLAYDSWVTIGLEGTPNAAAGEAAVSTVQSGANPWATNFDPGGGLPGGNISIDDAIGGAWYALNGDANGIAGPELKVLAGQFTTDGDISGQLYCQVFINGDGANEFRDTFYFGAGAPVLGCTDATACNYDGAATDDDGSCEFPADLYGSANLDCDGNCLNDSDEDGTCDEDEVPGCTDATACNYSEAATDDDSSCTYPAADNLDCDGNCLNDADSDLVCDEDEIAGCQDSAACNYDAAATDDNGSCTYPDGYPNNIVDCDGNCLNDQDSDLVCDENEIGGCQDAGACNYDAAATDDDGSCEYLTCAGCTASTACNYDDTATIDDGSCVYADDPCETCNPDGTVNPNDDDFDGVCNADETEGCTDPNACNDGAYTDTNNDLCEYPIDLYGVDNVDCDGVCLNDADGDLVCDEDEIAGCTDETACNYDAPATDDDGSCQYPIDLYGIDYVDCDGACLNDADGDGVCNEDETESCTDPAACNYNDDPLADSDNTLCVYASDIYGVDNVDCDGACLNDADGDLVCDEDEIAGCTDEAANNYDPAATDDDGSCTGCTNPIADNYYAGADIDDGTCVISGCTEAEACNYFAEANNEDGSCLYPIDLYGASNVDCDGACLNDADEDGTCDEDEDLDEVLDIINTESGDELDSTISIIGDLVLSGGGGSSNFADAFDGLGIGFVPDVGGQSTGMVASLDLSCSGIEDVTSVRISGPWWGWDPNGGPEAAEVSDGIWQVVFDPAPGADMEYKWVINGEYEDLLDFGADLLYGDGYDDYLNGACAPITDYYSYANRLWSMGSGDINDTWGQCTACSQVANCGTLFLPTDAAWSSAGYNLEALSQEVIGDLLAGHVFLGFCDALQNGEQLTNWYGEIFQFSDDGAGNRAIQSLISGDIYPVLEGAYSFDSGSKVYTLGGVIALASADPCLGCTELEMTGSIADYSVECESELDAAMAANDVAAFACSELELDAVYSTKLQFDGRNQNAAGGGTSQTWEVITAGDDPDFNNGIDALLQFYDIGGDMSQAAYFVEDLSAGGVTMTQYENGTALLEGAVMDMNDPNRGLDLHFYFDNRTAGTAWGGGFKNDYGCAANTDLWTMYVLNDDMSYATGRGDWQFGTLLRFNHQPSSQYFGYQLGDGANNHNCDANGFSGWFSWSGAITGEPAYGQAGDIISTLVPTVDYATDCQDGEFVEFHYAAFDELCNIAQLNVQTVDRNDVTAPTYVSGGDDITLDCAVSDQWLADNLAADEVVLFSDNCDDSEYGCAAGFDPNTAGFADGDNVFVCVELVGETTTSYTASSCRVLNRTWVATDCFGNQAFHVQVITIEDNTQPDVTVDAPADITLNVNGLCYVDLDPSNTGTAATTYADNCDLATTGLSYTDNVVDSISTGCYSIIRAWTAIATDSCGNANAVSDNQRIDIQDQIAPSFLYNMVDTIECDLWIEGACDYDYLNSLGLATASDNCELSHVDVECTPLSSACTDDYIIDYTAYDMCGNSTSVQQILVTADRTAPEFTLAPADLTLECSDASLTGDVDGYAVPEYAPGDGLHAEAMDNCDAVITVTYEDVILTTACDQEYVIRRTYSVYDCDENLAQHIQEITIDDSTAPEFASFPADVVDVECDAVPAVATIASLGTSDNCDGAFTVSYDGEVRTDGDCEDSYTLERTWTTSDCAGNSHTQTQTITVLDTQAPDLSIACPAEFPHINECFGSGPSNVTFTFITDQYGSGEAFATITDSEGAAVADYPLGYFANSDTTEETLTLAPGDYTITLGDDWGDGWAWTPATGEDAVSLSGGASGSLDFLGGSSASLDFTVTGDASAQLSTDTNGEPTWTVSDNCDADVEVSYTYSDDIVQIDGDYFITRTFTVTATDNCGNATTQECEQSITFTDSDGPLMSDDPAELYPASIACADMGDPFDVNFMPVSASDGCQSDLTYEVVSAYLTSGSCPGTWVRHWVAYDESGNVSAEEAIQYIPTYDIVAPEVSIAAPGISVGGGPVDVSFTYTLDNYGNSEAGASITDSEGNEIATYELGYFPDNGTVTETLTLDPGVYTITLLDGWGDGWAWAPATGEDAVVISGGAAGALDFTEGSTASMEFTVEAPPAAEDVVFTYTLDNYGNSEAGASITDSEGNEIATYELGYFPDNGTVTETLTLDPGVYTITLLDGWGDGWAWAPATGEDAVVISGGSTGALDFTEGSTVSMEFTVEGAGGGPTTTTVYLDENCYVDLSPDAIGYGTLEYSDDCDSDPTAELTYVDSPPSYTCGQAIGTYTFTRTWTATITDLCGNTSSDSGDQLITVVDNSAPELTLDCPNGANLVNVCFAEVDTSLAALGEVEWIATDNCDNNLDVSYTYTDEIEFDCSMVGVDANPEGSYNFVRTFTVTAVDCNGNSTTEVCTQVINTFDISAPTIEMFCPDTATVQLDADCLADLDPAITGSAFAVGTDNCDSDVTITYSYSDSSPAYTCGTSGYEIVRTWTASAVDDCGNNSSNSCDQLIIVEDNIAPVASITCPDDQTVLADENCEADLSTDALGMAAGSGTDNCDLNVTVDVTYTDGAPTYSCDGDDDQLDGSYSFVRTFTATATDDCGNSHSVTCDQNITVNDEMAPTQTLATMPTDTLYLDLNCEADLTPSVMPAVETADNCDSDVDVAISYEDYSSNFGALFGTVGASLETYAEHTTGPLAGMTTYRIYVQLPAEGDFLSSVSGEGQFSTQLRSTTSFYQNEYGGALAEGTNPVLFGLSPELEYDSWVTIGWENGPQAETVDVVGQWPIEFEAGGDLEIDGTFGGAWYTLNGNSNGYADADGKVLVAQLTTDGIVNGQLFIQYFPQGDGSQQQLSTVTIGDGCEGDDSAIEGSFVVPRTWQSIVTDDCGNADTTYTSQYIVVLDTIAPQFTNTCDIENGETVEYTCADDNGNGVNDIFDFMETPLACAPQYVENCDSEVSLTMTADTMGYVPTGDIANYCMPSTVEELANGETCDDRAPEAIRLFNFSGGESYTLVDGGSSIVEIMQDSVMHIVMEVQNEAGDAGFIFDATYEGGHDWNEWLALPGLHNYKKDCAEIFPGIEIWTEWIYYIMDGGTMSGTGRFAGSEFALSHQPLNAYYGLQVGEGANNKNENYGASAWFFWTGEYVLDGTSQGSMASSGDIFMDLDCCLGWQIDYAYNAVDDCSNSTGFSYTDLGTGTFGNSGNSTVSGGHTPVDITSGTSSLKDPIRITGLQPNPTSDISTLGFVVNNNMRLRIDLYTMGGGYVAELFDGNASEDVQYVLDIDASSLSSGMYQIRMSSNDYVLVKKLLVSE